MEKLIVDLKEISGTRFKDWRRVVWWSELAAVILLVPAIVTLVLQECTLSAYLMLGLALLGNFIAEEKQKARLRNIVERAESRRSE